MSRTVDRASRKRVRGIDARLDERDRTAGAPGGRAGAGAPAAESMAARRSCLSRRAGGAGRTDDYAGWARWIRGAPALGRGAGAGDGCRGSSALPRLHPPRADGSRRPLRSAGGSLRHLRRQLAGSGRSGLCRERSAALAGRSRRLPGRGRRNLCAGWDARQSLGSACRPSGCAGATRGRATGTLEDRHVGRGPLIGRAGSPGAGRRSDRRAGRCQSPFDRNSSCEPRSTAKRTMGSSPSSPQPGPRTWA